MVGNDEHYFQGLKDVFDEAIKVVLNKDKTQDKKNPCQILWSFEVFRMNNILTKHSVESVQFSSSQVIW